MSNYATITLQVDDRVGIVTLNRPDAGNAMNIRMTGELDEALWGLEADEDVRVIVITGAGKTFSTGWDLSEADGNAFGAEVHDEHNRKLGVTDREIAERYAFWRMRTPVIAAVNGMAIGAGLTITLLADFRVVAEDARLRFPFTRLNLLPEGGSNWVLPRLVGVTRALDLLLTGRWFTGAEAAQWGMATKAVPAEQVLSEALAIAREMADYTSPTAVGATKQLVYQFLETGDRLGAMERETRLTWWAGSQPDTVEGVMALMQKRKPEWKGSKHEPIPANDQLPEM